MSSIDVYRSTGPEDYLAAGERERRAKKAGNTAQNNTSIHGLITPNSAITITTLAEIDADTLEPTTTVNVANTLSLQGKPKTYRAVGGDFLTFTASPARGGTKTRDFIAGAGGFLRAADERAYAGFSEANA